MLNFLSNQSYELIVTASFTVTFVAITCCFVKSLGVFGNVTIDRPIDITRVQEGLPTDVTITPEDFRNHPELAEILEVGDTDVNLDLILESNEHFENVERFLSLYDTIVAFFSYFN
jgi:hypothetical protein